MANLAFRRELARRISRLSEANDDKFWVAVRLKQEFFDAVPASEMAMQLAYEEDEVQTFYEAIEGDTKWSKTQGYVTYLKELLAEFNLDIDVHATDWKRKQRWVAFTPSQMTSSTTPLSQWASVFDGSAAPPPKPVVTATPIKGKGKGTVDAGSHSMNLRPAVPKGDGDDEGAQDEAEDHAVTYKADKKRRSSGLQSIESVRIEVDAEEHPPAAKHAALRVVQASSDSQGSALLPSANNRLVEVLLLRRRTGTSSRTAERRRRDTRNFLELKYNKDLVGAIVDIAKSDMKAFRSAAPKVGVPVWARMNAERTLACVNYAHLRPEQVRQIERFIERESGTRLFCVRAELQKIKATRNLREDCYDVAVTKLTENKETVFIVVTNINAVIERDLDDIGDDFVAHYISNAAQGAVLVHHGDDSGQGEEKLMIQCVNTASPNSVSTVSVVGICVGSIPNVEKKQEMFGDAYSQLCAVPDHRVLCFSSASCISSSSAEGTVCASPTTTNGSSVSGSRLQVRHKMVPLTARTLGLSHIAALTLPAAELADAPCDVDASGGLVLVKDPVGNVIGVASYKPGTDFKKIFGKHTDAVFDMVLSYLDSSAIVRAEDLPRPKAKEPCPKAKAIKLRSHADELSAQARPCYLICIELLKADWREARRRRVDAERELKTFVSDVAKAKNSKSKRATEMLSTATSKESELKKSLKSLKSAETEAASYLSEAEEALPVLDAHICKFKAEANAYDELAARLDDDDAVSDSSEDQSHSESDEKPYVKPQPLQTWGSARKKRQAKGKKRKRMPTPKQMKKATPQSFDFVFGLVSFSYFHSPLESRGHRVDVLSRAMLDFHGSDLLAVAANCSMENMAPHACTTCETRTCDWETSWRKCCAVMRSVKSNAARFTEYLAQKTPRSNVCGVQSKAIVTTPHERMLLNTLHVLSTGLGSNMLEAIQVSAIECDTKDEAKREALLVVEGLRVAKVALDAALVEAEQELANERRSVASLKKDSDAAKLKVPESCRAATIKWPTAQRRGCTLACWNKWTLCWNAWAKAGDVLKALADDVKQAKDAVAVAGTQLETAEKAVADLPRSTQNAVRLGMKACNADALAYFRGGTRDRKSVV